MSKDPWDLENEIVRAAARLGMELAQLGSADAKSLRDRVLSLFCGRSPGSPTPMWLWNEFESPACRRDEAGWERLDSLPFEPVLLFLDEDESKKVWRLANGTAARDLLAAVPINFEFYVTDEHLSGLIAYSHHQVLSAVGSARAWLDGLPETPET